MYVNVCLIFQPTFLAETNQAKSAKPSTCHKTLVNRLVRMRRCVPRVL